MSLPVVSLRLVLTLPFVVGVSAATALTVGLFSRHERQIQSHLTLALVNSTQDRTNQDLQSLLRVPHLINRLNAGAYRSNLLTTLPAFERYFGQQIQQFPEVSRIAWLTAQGGTVGAKRLWHPAPGEASLYVYRTPQLAAGPVTRTPILPLGSPIPEPGDPIDVRTLPSYEAAAQGLQWSPVYATQTRPPVLAMAAVLPIRDPQGQLQGVFATDIYLTHLQGSLNQLIRSTPVHRLILLERSGRVLVDSDPAMPAPGALVALGESPDPLSQATLAQLTAIDPNWLDSSQEVTFPLVVAPTTYQVFLFPIRDAAGLDWLGLGWIAVERWHRGPDLKGLSIGIGAAVLGVIGLGASVSRSVSHAIHQMTQQATFLALGQPLRPLQDKPLPIRELQDLSQALQMLMGRFSGSFEQITNTIPGLIYLYDYASRTTLYVNHRLNDILGDTDPAPFRDLVERVHPEDRPTFLQHHLSLGQAPDNQVWSVILRVRHQDHSYRWLHAYEVVFSRDDQGSPREILGAAIDITSAHLLQTELMLSEQRFRTLLENLNVGVIVHSQDTTILFHNPAALELLGLTSAQLLGTTSFAPQWRVIQEDGSPLPPQHHPVSLVIATRQPIHDVVIGVYRPQEPEPVWLSVNGDPLFNEAGEMEEVLVSFSDISVRIRAQTILKDHNLTLSSLARNSTLQLGRSLTLMSLSQKITEHLRASLDEKEILQRVVEELVPALGLAFADIGIYDLERQVSTIAYECSTLSERGLGRELPFSHNPPLYEQLRRGIPFQLSVTVGYVFQTYQTRFLKLACPIQDEQGTWADLWCARSKQILFTEQEIAFVQQIAADCTIAVRQARLYAAAQAQVKALEQLNYLKDDFVSTVSHELRTPLSTMKMALRLLTLSQAQDPLTPKQLQYLQTLEAECEREISIINDLLDLQRLAAFGADSDIRAIAIPTWIADLVKTFTLRAEERQQSLILRCPESLPLLRTDPHLLDRVLRELLTNACKYTPPGETISLEVEHLPQETAHPFWIRVINTGVTIPAELLPKIFDKFYRIPSHDRWKQGGTGLGLALVKQICQTMGAALTVENRPDPAVVFALGIPDHPCASTTAK